MSELKIAVVGSGPAGMYAIEHLLQQSTVPVRIDLFERLPTPWGLVRAGVAPDHPEKKQIVDRLFHFHLKDQSVRFIGNVEVGRDISPEELSAHYHAVIYAHGADGDKALGISGEDLPGSWSARQFVAWYNGHPDHSDLPFDFSSPRAVVIGTGNVALDVARMLLLPHDRLAETDMASHALAALRASQVREVVLLGRRGCQQAAFHNPELEELLDLDGVAVEVDAHDLLPQQAPGDWATRRKLDTLVRLRDRHVDSPDKRLVFKFHHRPVAIQGHARVTGLRIAPTGTADTPTVLPCGLVLRAIGYRGKPLADLPFDPVAGVVSNVTGRVMDGTLPRAGAYVAGWIKRGPRGVIGSNKQCAAETVASLLTDARAGRLAVRDAADVVEELADRQHLTVSYRGWQRIDVLERQAGRAQGRPREKKTDTRDLLAATERPNASVAAPERSA